MKNYNILILPILLILVLKACVFSTVVGSGDVVHESRKLSNFHTVKLDGSLDVNILSGDNFICNLSGDNNLVPLVVTIIENNTLRISIDGSYSTKNPLVVNLEMPVVKKAKISGSGDIRIIDATEDTVVLIINGSGDIAVNGSVNVLEAKVNGSGDLSLQNLKANRVNVIINGSGDAQVWANKSISAQVNGSGDLSYSGDPKEVNVKVNGSGEIKKNE